ncbi:MAG: hypothetical protein KME32_36345 [Mojavia pulchra JT2-VF2]|jgi:hypothetical protein|uniref:Uncharacterized protein n=1 Tax=Mojavia pulchra JT2-VF2 TaxID=287848 RepID=A0A951Q7T8_9NOST|nr:hypothetical protein [Mojavia pulchra JT2-VF2]
MKNNDRPVLHTGRVRLSGVVTAPHGHSPNCSASGAWKEILISSFVETRFKNVLARTTVLPKVGWFWHHPNSTHVTDEAVALIAYNTNDYKQILIKHNQLTNTLQDLDPVAEVLLLISPVEDFVFGTVSETREMFSTHILFVQKCYGQNSQANLSIAHPNSCAAGTMTSKAYANNVGGRS